MSKFAKLFDVADTQVLYLLEEDDDGHPGVRMRTSVNGMSVSVMPTCDGGDVDKQWEWAEAVFNKIDQEAAERFHAHMLGQFGGFSKEIDKEGDGVSGD